MMRKRRLMCAAWAAATLVCGLAVRMAPLGLPWGVAKYGGSALWAVMIYWVLAVVFSDWRPVRLGSVASAIAVAVEFGKLYRSPGMDAFRLTLPGKLLLGRFFSGWDILAYLAGLGIVTLFDALVLTKRPVR
jgi:hypothetical protein